MKNRHSPTPRQLTTVCMLIVLVHLLIGGPLIVIL
jgi:hypothetical protein